jgi:F-type H+-transporting ATPase subunit b
MRTRLALAGATIAVVSILGAPGTAHAAEDIPKANEECITLLKQPGRTIDDCQKAPNPILPATNELVWGALAFGVLLVLMWKFGLPPVRKMLKDREDRIRDDLERAEHARTEAETTLEEYRRQVSEARAEGTAIIEQARQDAERVRAERIAAVDQEIAEQRTRAQEDIRLGSERAVAELRAQMADLSIELAERVVEANLDHDRQLALIESYINQVGSN